MLHPVLLLALTACMHAGVKFTMVSDCCHSGSMLDHPEQQIFGDYDKENGDDGFLASFFRGAKARPRKFNSEAQSATYVQLLCDCMEFSSTTRVQQRPLRLNVGPGLVVNHSRFRT